MSAARFTAVFGLAASLSATAASAQALLLPGELGNEGGCTLLRSGSVDTDEVIILRPAEIQQYESVCEFLDVKRSRAGPQVVRSLCSGEGAYWLMDFIVSDIGDGRHVINFGEDRPDVTVSPCG